MNSIEPDVQSSQEGTAIDWDRSFVFSTK